MSYIWNLSALHQILRLKQKLGCKTKFGVYDRLLLKCPMAFLHTFIDVFKPFLQISYKIGAIQIFKLNFAIITNFEGYINFWDYAKICYLCFFWRFCGSIVEFIKESPKRKAV